MIWNVQKVEETKDEIVVAYSKNTTFDGKIKYDKQRETFKLISIASDCDEFESKRVFQFLYTLLLQNTLSFQPYSIVTG